MIQTITVLFIASGILLIFANIMKLPTLKTSKAFTNLSKHQKKKTRSIDIWLKNLSIALSKYIKLNEYKRIKIASDLQTANLNITPELHISNAIVKAAIVGLLTIPAFMIFPMILLLIAALSVAVYLKETKEVEERIRVKRNSINYELPRFVFTIDKTLKHNRNVLSILEDYKDKTTPELKHELSITVADMRSGNYESALTRLEARVGSTMLSDVTRGLIGVLRGDETEMYWASLSIKFADIQRQILKQ